MRLKSLKLAGFKSFANPTLFTFKHDITAIVGPNGCGKSNVIDAIRWVLGETSAKQLRGGAMSDVIFAGVEGRAAKSLASVELTFEHTQDEAHGIRHELNLYQELSLRRQVTKEGKSDYFINGQRVRRRDVVDVFLGTGLGARSYAVIEQGMIGRIVESSPMQLREFIEEGAGVSRYQVRRADTEKKLAETRENLERLSDLQGELKKQHKTLIRQAQSAKEYEALSSELAKLQQDDLLRRLFEAWQYHELKKGEQGKSGEALSQLEANVSRVRRELDAFSERVAQAMWLKDDARNNYHNAQMAEQAAQHNFYTLNSEISQNEEKITRLNTQKTQTAVDITQANADIADIDAKLVAITPSLEAMNADSAQAKAALDEAQAAWQRQRDEVGELGAQKNALENQQKLAATQLQRLKLSEEKWQKKSDELGKLAQTLTDDNNDEAELAQLHTQIKNLQERLDSLDDETLKQTHRKASDEIAKLQATLNIDEKRHASLMGEYEILHKLIHQPTAKKSTADSAQLADLPLLKDTIRLSKQGERYTQILDAFLGFWLTARTGKTLPVAALANIPDKDSLFLNEAKLNNPPIALPSDIAAQLVSVDTLIQTPKLAVFAQCYVHTGDDEAAFFEQLAKADLTGVLIITQNGWLIGGFGMVHISRFGADDGAFLREKQAHTERLAVLEDELNALDDTLEAAQKTIKTQQAQLENLKIELEEQAAQKLATTNALHQAEQAATKLNAAINTRQLQQQTLQKSRTELAQELDELQKERKTLSEQQAQASDELAKFAPKLEAATAAMTRLNALIDEKTAAMRARSEDAQKLQLEHAALTQGKTHAERLLSMAQANALQIANDIADTEKKQQTLQEKLPVLEDAFKKARSSSHELKIISEEHEAAARTLQLGQTKLQEELNDAHGKFATAQAMAAQITADAAVGESRVQDLGDELVRLDDKFNLAATLADFRANPTQNFTDNSEQQAAVKQKIAKLGAVNLAAASELAELEARVSPMDEQIADITASMVKLQDAIRAIDEQTKQLFLNALNAVNKELNALFSKVFGGGQASLTLMDDETLPKADKWRAGLVLMAQPKGKKNSRLAVLSGGEKTLTALSLIFAIFKQHPAPFCVLDEVDAPLDDANVARFTGLISELASSVQFIFISHNKLAMQIADELKGITMPTAGISSLVTVDLQEAEQYLQA